MGLVSTFNKKLETACQVTFGEKWSRNYVRKLQSEIVKQEAFGLGLEGMMGEMSHEWPPQRFRVQSRLW